MNITESHLLDTLEWASAGADPTDSSAPSAHHLAKLENADLLELISVDAQGDGGPRVMHVWNIQLTARGEYELERLLAIKERGNE